MIKQIILTRDGLRGIILQNSNLVAFGKEITLFSFDASINSIPTLKYKILNILSPKIGHIGALADTLLDPINLLIITSGYYDGKLMLWD